MKKILILTLMTILASSAVHAAIPVKFQKHGGGQFIYCNNTEFIKESDLSTVENPNAKYMMNNEKLQPGKYSVFFCFYNWTDFAVEPDIEFKTESNAVISIDSIGYYIPQANEEWDCLGVWADYLKTDIRSVENIKEYIHYSGNELIPARFEINGENEWISKYIYNYEPIQPKFTFNMVVDFTIVSGESDVNFAALKSYGKVGDRSMHNPDAKFGSYLRDTAIKGIERETLPIVEADIEVVIDENTPNGENLDVIVFNRRNPEGVVVPCWTSNINPDRDGSLYCRNTAVTSDMLEFVYEDDYKLTLYGENVPQEKRDNIWRMDINHFDTQHYSDFMPWRAEEHIPNGENEEYYNPDSALYTELEFNLGNFGVTNRHNFKITNNDRIVRSFNYYINSSKTSNIAIVRDKEGEMLNPYTLERENAFALNRELSWDERKEICMFSVEVDPGETKEYTLDIILPTNNFGGQINVLKADIKKQLTSPESTTISDYDDYINTNNVFFNGEKYMKWENGLLYLRNEGEWENVLLPEKTKRIFEEMSYKAEIIKTNNGYAARYSAWDKCVNALADTKIRNKVYIFDKDFNLKNIHEFGDYIHAISFADRLYVKSENIYKQNNGGFELAEHDIPVSNGKFSFVKIGEELYETEGENKIKIDFEMGFPNEVFSGGKAFWSKKSMKSDCTEIGVKNVISVSRDGVEWTDFELGDAFLQNVEVFCEGEKLLVKTKYENFEFDYPNDNNVRVCLNGELLAFDTPAKIVNNRTMVPMRFFFEKLGAEVKWEETTKEIRAEKNGRQIKLWIGNSNAIVDGEEKRMDTAPYIENDRTLIPMRFLSENLGFDVDWEEETRTASAVVKNY